MFQALVGRYSAHATASVRTILSRPEPKLHHFPPCSLFLFSARYTAIAAWRPDTRDGHLQGWLLHTLKAV